MDISDPIENLTFSPAVVVNCLHSICNLSPQLCDASVSVLFIFVFLARLPRGHTCLHGWLSASVWAAVCCATGAGGTGSSASPWSALAMCVCVALSQRGVRRGCVASVALLSTVTHHISSWCQLGWNVSEPGFYFSHWAPGRPDGKKGHEPATGSARPTSALWGDLEPEPALASVQLQALSPSVTSRLSTVRAEAQGSRSPPRSGTLP